jgi:hypothetical protein
MWQERSVSYVIRSLCYLFDVDMSLCYHSSVDNSDIPMLCNFHSFTFTIHLGIDTLSSYDINNTLICTTLVTQHFEGLSKWALYLGLKALLCGFESHSQICSISLNSFPYYDLSSVRIANAENTIHNDN